MVANPEEIKRWVIGYGSHVKVLKPKSLVKEIKEDIGKLSKIYEGD